MNNIYIIDRLAGLYRLVGQEVLKEAKKRDRIDMIILALSTLTAGSLWTLLAGVVPPVTTWAGAVFGSLGMGLKVYQLSSMGPSKRSEDLNKLFRQIGGEIYRLYNQPQEAHPPRETLQQLRTIEARLVELGYPPQEL